MKILIILLCSLFALSCVTQKKCLQKFPPVVTTIVKDSLVIRDSISIRDVIVHDTIQGDTQIVTVMIPGSPGVVKDIAPMILENDYAVAKAWIQNQEMNMELKQKEQVITRILEGAARDVTHWKELYQSELTREVVTTNKIPRWWKILTGILGVLSLLFLLLIAKRLKLI